MARRTAATSGGSQRHVSPPTGRLRRAAPTASAGRLVRVHRQLRSHRRVPRRGVGHLLEPAHPARSSATTTSAGAAGQQARPRPRDQSVPTADNGGKTYTFKLQERRQVRPAGQPPGQGVRHRLRAEAPREPEGRRRSTRFYYSVIKGWDDVASGKAKTDLRHQDARRPDDRHPPDAADRRLPLPDGDAGDRARSRPRSASASRASPATTAATSSRRGPYMMAGAAGQRLDMLVAAADQAATRATTAQRT